MRISFFVPRCTPDNSHGRYVIELAKRLGHEHSVTVYSGAHWPPLHSKVNCRFLPTPNRPAVARLAALWTSSTIGIKRRPTEIVHIQGADAPVGNVVTAHCCNAAMMAAMDGKGSLTRRLNYSIGVAAERYCLTKPSTRTVIAVSGKVKIEIQEHYGVDAKKIVVVPLAVDAETFNPGQRATWRASVRTRLGFGGDEFMILFVGADYRLKGLVPLLRAAARVEGVRILSVGVKPDAELDQVVRKNRLEGFVRFLDNTSDIALLYAASDCFVLPTLYDTFSLSTLEAMASGLPVIVSRAAGVTELLSPERDCLILENPNDVDAITHHLKRVVLDNQLRTRLGTEARKTAEKYSWDEVTSRTVAIYRESLVSP